MIDFSKSKFTRADYERLKSIVDRVKGVDRISAMMDIEAANMVCPLDLEKLAAFDKFNLMHDVFGIANNLDRETGELKNCFLPRCAK